MQRFFLGLAALFLCLGSPAHVLLAGDYYVINNEGATGGTGTAGDPWGTITEAFNAGVLGPGDTLWVASGGYANTRGENFPLNLDLVDGATICGQGGGSTVLWNDDTNGVIFEVGDLLSPTVVKSVGLNASDWGFSITGTTIVNLTIQHCLVNGDIEDMDALVYGDLTNFGQININVLQNWLSEFDDGVIYLDATDGGPVNLKVNENECAYIDSGLIYADFSNGVSFDFEVNSNHCGMNYADIYLEISDSANGGATGTVNVHNNKFIYGEYGLYFCFDADSGAQGFDVRTLVSNNSWVGYTEYIFYLSSSVDDNGTLGFAYYEVHDNVMELCTDTVVEWEVSAWDSGALFVSGDWRCNDLTAGEDYGLYLYAWCDDSAFLEWDVLFQSNQIAGNSSTGVDICLNVYDNASLSAALAFKNNNIIGNGSYGVSVDTDNFSVSTGILLQAPDFGGGLLLSGPGCNTIKGNDLFDDPATATVTSVWLDGDSTGLVIPFTGNFWYSDSLGDIEDRIDHAPDGNDGTVDFANPLPTTLTFSGPLASVAGGLVALGATGGSKFVQKAGTLGICVTVDGIRVGAAVGANGNTLTFATPFGIFSAAPVQVVVKNPGGQIGVMLLSVTPGGSKSSICFVATASYGDVHAPEVLVLQRWRDECLADNAVGRQFVKAYYALSPGLAEAISDSPAARTVSRAALTPVVGAVKLWLEMPWLYGLGAAGALLLLLRRSK